MTVPQSWQYTSEMPSAEHVASAAVLDAVLWGFFATGAVLIDAPHTVQ